ncbi:MAG: alpha/beta fold hydrolase [Acidobacteriota bacterium]
MPGMKGLARHLSVALLGATIGVGPISARQTPDVSGSATFIVLVSGTRVGTETVDIARRPTGWVISSSGFVRPPFDLVTDKFEMLYSADWQPQKLTVAGSLRAQPLAISSTFTGTTAVTQITQGDQHGSGTHGITAGSVVLASNIFAAYEALAIRASSMQAGDKVPVYIAPNGDATANIVDITPKRVSLGSATVDLRAIRLTVSGTNSVVPLELWVDARGRLARLALPATSLVVIRDDLATVMAREDRPKNSGDKEEFIGANGFSLGATVTAPSVPAARSPVVILAAGPGPQDRDHNVFGVPVFADLARQLASAGNIVVRYDVRGTGRSGGRAESSRLAEYSDDVIGIVKSLEKRKDVDPKRIVVAGYGEAAAVALTAASREDGIAGVVLLGASAQSGRDTTLDQQRRLLAPLPLSDTERAARSALQTRIMDAVISGKGWESLPPDVRDQADTPWFRSWLEFDPSKTLKNMDQPVLIVQGSLDAEMPPSNADRLEQLSSSRSKLPASATRKVIVPGTNHLLVPARTGTVDEYPLLETRAVAPAVAAAIADWIKALR